MSEIMEEGVQRVIEILQDMNVDPDVIDKFRTEKITLEIGKLLTDENLKDLGLIRMGVRVMFKSKCREIEENNSVAQEVRRIMSPSSTVSYNKKNRSFQSTTLSSALQIPRREKNKTPVAYAKYSFLTGKGSKGKQRQSATFQKKLVVFQYMGSPRSAPAHFTRKDSYILVRGLLPDISLDASEKMVRKEIADVINSSNSLGDASCGIHDFEFIDLNGKHATVPNVKQGLEFTGRAVKNLAGSGNVYVRMTSDMVISIHDSSDSGSVEDEFPDASFLTECNPPKRRTISPTVAEWISSDEDRNDFLPSLRYRYKKPCRDITSGDSSLENSTSTLRSPVSNVSSSAISPCTTPSLIPRVTQFDDIGCSSRMSIPSNTGNDSSLEKLCEILCDFSVDDVKFVFMTSGESFENTLNCMLEGPSLKSICGLLKSRFISDDIYRIRIDSDDTDDFVMAALGYYKSSNYKPRAEVRVTLKKQAAVDTGGVRRQFFSTVFGAIASSEKLGLFDGQPDHRRPAFKMSNLSSGIFKILGQMIGHSLLLDCQGFPFLSECMYYSLVGQVDKATTLISMNDLSENVKSIIEQMSLVQSIEEFCFFNELVDLMQESGIDLPLKAKYKQGIIENIMVYDAIHKRQVYLDALGKGLQEYGLLSFMQRFPEIVKEAFIHNKDLVPGDVLGILKPAFSYDNDEAIPEKRVYKCLCDFIESCSRERLMSFLLYITGIPSVTGNEVYVTFDKHGAAIAANTCSKSLSIPTNTEPEIFSQKLAGCN